MAAPDERSLKAQPRDKLRGGEVLVDDSSRGGDVRVVRPMGVVSEWHDDNFDSEARSREYQDRVTREALDRHAPIEGGYQTTLFEAVNRKMAEQLAERVDAEFRGTGLYAGLGQRKTASPEELEVAVGDDVTHPRHYNMGPSETIDVIRQAVGEEGLIAHCIANVIKYATRAQYKGNRTKDMRKAAWYARLATGDDPRKERR